MMTLTQTIAALPAEIIIGHTDLPEIALSLSAVGTGSRVIDVFVMQNLVRAPFGEAGLCVGGYWEGFIRKESVAGVNNGTPVYILNVAAYRAWLATIPGSTKWLDLDIESYAGEFAWPSEATNRCFRIMHAIAIMVCPWIKCSCYIDAAMLPGSPSGNPKFKDMVNALGYGVSDIGKQVATRGLFDANHIIACQFYPNEATTFDDIDEYIYGVAPYLIDACHYGQVAGLWTCPTGSAIASSAGLSLSNPIRPRTMAHIGSVSRRAGLKAVWVWGYQSDETGFRTPPLTEEQRPIARVVRYESTFAPSIEALCEAFL